jgi:hypothetical protein
MSRLIKLFACVALGSFLIFSACKKQAALIANPDAQLIEEARSYFAKAISLKPQDQPNQSPRQSSPKDPIWDKAYTVELSIGKVVLVPVQYKNTLYIKNNFGENQLRRLDDFVKLLMYKDALGAFHIELITSLPDTSNKVAIPFTGITCVEDWDGKLLRQYKFDDQGRRYKFDINKIVAAKAAKPQSSLPKVMPTNVPLEIDIYYYIDGYNYSPDDYSGGTSWSEYIGSSTYYVSDDGGDSEPGIPSGGDYVDAGGSGGTGKGPGSSSNITIASGTNIIADINDYNKCFTNYGGSDHTYQVTLCVNQPVPGGRDPWTPTAGGLSGSSATSNPVNVGHVFLVFSENFTDHSIVRNVGLYPQGIITPWATSDQGQLNNDEGHTYNISLSVSLTNVQFYNMLNYIAIGNNPGYIYDLNDNNCTTFALHALSAGGVSVPSTMGTWIPNGYGNDPGDLGEDIRYMTLAPNMTRSTVGNFHPNQGTCQ